MWVYEMKMASMAKYFKNCKKTVYSDFKIIFEDILTLVITQWIINPFGEVEEKDVTLQNDFI